MCSYGTDNNKTVTIQRIFYSRYHQTNSTKRNKFNKKLVFENILLLFLSGFVLLV